MSKQVMTAVKLMPLAEGITLPFFTKNIDDNERFNSNELIDKSVSVMMKELLKWTAALKSIRLNEKQ
jgi:hypothetical protein